MRIRRLRVVVCEERRALVRPAGGSLEPPGEGRMQSASASLWNRSIRNLSRERVLDDELAVVSRSRATLGHEIPLLENPEVRLRAVEEMHHRTAPEHAADDCAGLKRGLLQRGEAVDPRREHRVHGVRHREAGVGAADRPAVPGLDERAAVDELADELFEEERVSVGALDEAVAQIVRQSSGAFPRAAATRPRRTADRARGLSRCASRAPRSA